MSCYILYLRLMYASLLSFFPRLDCVVIKDASLVKFALVLLFANYVATPTSEKCALPWSPSCVWRIYDAWKGRRCQWEEIKEVNNLIKNAPLHTRSSFALLWLHGRLFYKHFCSHFLILVDIFFLGVCNEIDLLLPGLRFHNYFWLNIPCITRLLFPLATSVTETGKTSPYWPRHDYIVTLRISFTVFSSLQLYFCNFGSIMVDSIADSTR